MSKPFNKDILFSNITYLMKRKNMKIGDLEKKAGVSTGYISRASKTDEAKPGIDFIMSVADILGISVDVLLKHDLSRVTWTEEYVLSFLTKLEQETAADGLDWETEKADDLKAFALKQNGYRHPLFEMRNRREMTASGSPVEVERYIFASRSFGTRTLITGDCFNLAMGVDKTLYVMRVADNDSYKTATEIWFNVKGEQKPNRYLCSTEDAEIIADSIENLYSAISENVRHPKVDKDIMKAINAFMDEKHMSIDDLLS